MLKLTSLSNAPRVPFGFEGRKLHCSNKIEVIHINLKPGEATPVLMGDFDVLVWVGKGQALVETRSIKAHVESGTLVELKRDVDRSIANDSNSPSELLIIKVFDRICTPIVNNL